MTENPLYKPTPKTARILALAEERRQQAQATGQPVEPLNVPEVPEQSGIGEAVVKEISARFGFLPPAADELKRIDREQRAGRPSPEGRALELTRRRATFNKICPEKFREPWEWDLVKPEVERDEVRKVFGWQYGPRGLYVVGDSGHSKTRALFILLRRLIEIENRTVLFMDGVEFSNLCTKAFGKPDETEAILAPLIKADVLAIDDMAKRWTPSTEEGAFTVIDRRTARNKPVLLTLNYTTDDLFAMQQMKGDMAAMRDLATPLIRRLVDYCDLAVL